MLPKSQAQLRPLPFHLNSLIGRFSPVLERKNWFKWPVEALKVLDFAA